MARVRRTDIVLRSKAKTLAIKCRNLNMNAFHLRFQLFLVSYNPDKGIQNALKPEVQLMYFILCEFQLYWLT